MATRPWLAACNLLFALALVHRLQPAVGIQRVFILEAHQRGLLCGYTSEAEWSKVPKERDTEFTAVVTLTNGVATSVLVERYSEDTNTYDEYTIDKTGDVRRLKRTRDVIPDRVTREQTWNIQGGTAVKVSESWMQFRTHMPIPPDSDFNDFPENPIILRIADFPFSALIKDDHPELWKTGMRCVPGSMDKLEGPAR